MRMRIWLDDVRPAPDGWVWMKNARQVIDAINAVARAKITTGTAPILIEEISFDHDLGDESAQTGYHVINHIEYLVHTMKDFDVPKMHIHSANPVGRKNMMAAINAITRYRG